MDEREDYGDNDLPSILSVDWRDATRNLLVAGVLIGLAVLAAGVVVVKVTSMRHIRLPEVPAPDTSFQSEPAPFRVVGPSSRV